MMSVVWLVLSSIIVFFCGLVIGDLKRGREALRRMSEIEGYYASYIKELKDANRS